MNCIIVIPHSQYEGDAMFRSDSEDCEGTRMMSSDTEHGIDEDDEVHTTRAHRTEIEAYFHANIVKTLNIIVFRIAIGRLRCE